MAEVRPTIIGLAGGTGSGKTTVTQALLRHLGNDAVLVQHDWYYRDQRDVPRAERDRVNYDHPDAQETSLLVAHIDALHQGQAIVAPQYDFATHTRTGETQRISPRPYVIVEGINTLASAALRARCDLTVFVDTPADVRFARRLRRDVAERGRTVDSVVAQYLEHVRPMHEAYVEPGKTNADLVLSGESDVEASVEAILARLAQGEAVLPRMLLLSNSAMAGEPYLAWARAHIAAALEGADDILFVPYAAVEFSYDDYLKRVCEGLGDVDGTLTSIHTVADKAAALKGADAIIVGGGNTFSLLAACQREGILRGMRDAVRRGAWYIGWSAGANLACPTIKTTNDMPIESPAGLDALGLITFQINPHYTSGNIAGHGGESREQRLREFAVCNPDLPVLALPEGMYLNVADGAVSLSGSGEAFWFCHGGEPKSVAPGSLTPP